MTGWPSSPIATGWPSSPIATGRPSSPIAVAFAGTPLVRTTWVVVASGSMTSFVTRVALLGSTPTTVAAEDVLSGNTRHRSGVCVGGGCLAFSAGVCVCVNLQLHPSLLPSRPCAHNVAQHNTTQHNNRDTHSTSHTHPPTLSLTIGGGRRDGAHDVPVVVPVEIVEAYFHPRVLMGHARLHIRKYSTQTWLMITRSRAAKTKTGTSVSS